VCCCGVAGAKRKRLAYREMDRRSNMCSTASAFKALHAGCVDSHIYASELGTPARVTAARFVPVPGFARDVPDAPALAQQVYYAVSIGHVQYVHGGALRAATLGGPEALHQVLGII
jgi:hypothetical protein